MDLRAIFFLFITRGWSALYNEQIVCVGPYALCATVTCDPIPGSSTHASCTCFGPYDGINIGNTTSCEDRTDSLISTFSLVNPYAATSHRPPRHYGKANENPALYAFSCEGNNTATWVSCRDAPCSIKSGKAICTCLLKPASTNLFYGTGCPADEVEKTRLCKKLRATNALADGLDQAKIGKLVVQSTLGEFYGKPPVVSDCVI